jgi:Nitronate monooxygenase
MHLISRASLILMLSRLYEDGLGHQVGHRRAGATLWHSSMRRSAKSGMGGVAGSALAAEVSKAGGLGILAVALLPMDQFRQGTVRAGPR